VLREIIAPLIVEHHHNADARCFVCNGCGLYVVV
jgi:hypothetical protein